MQTDIVTEFQNIVKKLGLSSRTSTKDFRVGADGNSVHTAVPSLF